MSTITLRITPEPLGKSEQQNLLEGFGTIAKRRKETLEEFLLKNRDAYEQLRKAGTIHVGPRVVQTRK